MRRLPLLASFLLFILLCASVAYWAMQLFKPPLRPVAAPPRVSQPEIRPQAAATLFGARGRAAAASSNYQLRGVIFSGNPRDSVAIISADGKPAQAVRVESEIVPGVTVKEVHRGYVLIAEGGATKRIELPQDAPAQASAGVSINPALPPVQRTPIPTPSAAPPTRAQAAAAGAPVPPIGAPPTGAMQPPGVAASQSQAAPPQPAAPQPNVPPQTPMATTTAPPPNTGFVPPQSPLSDGAPPPPPPMANPPGANPVPQGQQ